MFAVLICSNRLKSKIIAFLGCFKIHCIHTISFPAATPSKTVSSRNSIAFQGRPYE